MHKILYIVLSFMVGSWFPLPRPTRQLPATKIHRNQTSLATPTPISNIISHKTIAVPILLYHYVEYVTDKHDAMRKLLDVTPQIFEQQLLTIMTAGYHPITPRQLAAYFDDQYILPSKPIILSFDDGYADFYTDVFPILQKHSTPAILYMVSRFLDTSKNYLTTQELIDIDKSGLIEIGAHTTKHKDLAHVIKDEALYEIAQSKKDLEQLLGHKVTSFAYPYGAYTRETENLVSEVGFTSSVTTHTGIIQSPEYRFSLPRVRPGTYTGDALIAILEGK
jgi:peptidoglycan/xylan/chitin deacetylase (PgdA/CDA1 family)